MVIVVTHISLIFEVPRPSVRSPYGAGGGVRETDSTSAVSVAPSPLMQAAVVPYLHIGCNRKVPNGAALADSQMRNTTFMSRGYPQTLK
jgi:hypothetical protein